MKMFGRKRFLSLVVSVAVLALSIAVIQIKPGDGQDAVNSPDIKPSDKKHTVAVSFPDEVKKNDRSFVKGVWIPYMSLDMKGTDRSENAAGQRLDEIFEGIKSSGADTAFLHVRPFGDALYKSRIFPSSHVLSGVQGKYPGYDFLSLAAAVAKQKGIHLHAWINPLRISLKNIPEELSDDNPCVKWQNDDDSENDRWTFRSGDVLYYNPAYPAVRKLIADGVRELVRNYDIDGIVIDDYFYPEDDMDCDKHEYDLYCEAAGLTYLSQENWRKGNINSLISSLYSAVHYERSECVFGISPQCNIDNNEKIAADIRTWGRIPGYADYISPQIYVSEKHPTLPFEKSLKQWQSIVTAKDIRLYVSLALYKEGTDADGGTWLLKDTNITDQIGICRKAGTDGVILYSYENMAEKG